MAPTIVRHGPYRLFFFFREEPRMRVHVAHPDGEAKLWLQPQATVANHTGLSAQQLAEAERIVMSHLLEIIHAWHQHLGP